LKEPTPVVIYTEMGTRPSYGRCRISRIRVGCYGGWMSARDVLEGVETAPALYRFPGDCVLMDNEGIPGARQEDPLVARKVTAETLRQILADSGLPASDAPDRDGFRITTGMGGCPIPGCNGWPGRPVIAVSLARAGDGQASLHAAAAALRARGLYGGAGVFTPPITDVPAHAFTAHLELLA
jgi:hypothetical protein